MKSTEHSSLCYSKFIESHINNILCLIFIHKLAFFDFHAFYDRIMLTKITLSVGSTLQTVETKLILKQVFLFT